MFGIGMNEIMLLVILGVVIIGPKRLPEVARTMGKLMAQFKRATNDLRSAVSDEINTHEELKDLKEISSEINSSVRDIKGRAQEYIEAEMSNEASIAGSVGRDMKELADGVKSSVREGAEEVSGTTLHPSPPDGVPGSLAKITGGHKYEADPQIASDEPVAAEESGTSEEPVAAEESGTADASGGDSAVGETGGDGPEASEPKGSGIEGVSQEGFARYQARHSVVPKAEEPTPGPAVDLVDSPEDAAIAEIDARNRALESAAESSAKSSAESSTESSAESSAKDGGMDAPQAGEPSAASDATETISQSDAGTDHDRTSPGGDG